MEKIERRSYTNLDILRRDNVEDESSSGDEIETTQSQKDNIFALNFPSIKLNDELIPNYDKFVEYANKNGHRSTSIDNSWILQWDHNEMKMFFEEEPRCYTCR